MQTTRAIGAVLLALTLAAGAAHAQTGWGGDVDRRGEGRREGGRGRWGGGESQMPAKNVIDGPIAPADLMGLVPLTPEQQRAYVAAYDSMMDATHVQRDTLHTFMAAHRPAHHGRPPEAREGKEPDADPAAASDGDGVPSEDGAAADDESPPAGSGGIPASGSVDDPRRTERRAFEQGVLSLAEPLQAAEDDFEKLMPRLLTKTQMKAYAKWYEEHNQIKRQYPRWYGHTDPNADGETYGH